MCADVIAPPPPTEFHVFARLSARRRPAAQTPTEEFVSLGQKCVIYSSPLPDSLPVTLETNGGGFSPRINLGLLLIGLFCVRGVVVSPGGYGRIHHRRPREPEPR